MLFVSQALAEANQRLAPLSETPALDAQVLLAHLLTRPRAWVLAHLDHPMNEGESAAFEDSLRRLEGGEPLPYLIGHWEFYGLDFLVSPAVLIPRPETELLVEEALAWLDAHPELSHPLGVDVGTGSGCIAVALAVTHPTLQMLAIDRSLPALRLARKNVARHNLLDRIHLIQSDLLSAIARRSPITQPLAPKFHLICANLPYIPTRDLEELWVARAEPRLALDGGSDGLTLVRRLLGDARDRMAQGGRLLMEIEASQGQAAFDLAKGALPSARTRLLTDLAGKDRLICIDN